MIKFSVVFGDTCSMISLWVTSYFKTAIDSTRNKALVNSDDRKPSWGPAGIAILPTVKPVYNDHLMGYFSASWSSSRWPRAT